MSSKAQHRRRSRKATVAAVTVLTLLVCAWLAPSGMASAATSSGVDVRIAVLDSLGIGGDAREIYAEEQHGPQFVTRFVMGAASLVRGDTGEAAETAAGTAGNGVLIPLIEADDISVIDGAVPDGMCIINTATHL